MRVTTFFEHLTKLHEEKPGGSILYVAGSTAVHSVAVLGNITGKGPGDRPFLYVARARLTDIDGENEQLCVTTFNPDGPGVEWSYRGPGRVTLHEPAEPMRLIIPTSHIGLRAFLNGAPVATPFTKIGNGNLEPPQAMPTSLAGLTAELVSVLPPAPPELRVVA